MSGNQESQPLLSQTALDMPPDDGDTTYGSTDYSDVPDGSGVDPHARRHPPLDVPAAGALVNLPRNVPALDPADPPQNHVPSPDPPQAPIPVPDPPHDDPPQDDPPQDDPPQDDPPQDDPPQDDPPQDDPPQDDPPQDDPPQEDPPQEDPPQDDPPQDDNRGSVSCCRKFLIHIFYCFCMLSGQLFVTCCCCNLEKYTKCNHFILPILSGFSWFFCFLFLIINFLSLLFNMYVIGRCPYKYCTYFCSKYYNSRDVIDAFVRYQLPDSVNFTLLNETSENFDMIYQIQPENITQYENWNKAVITGGTVSGFLSYYVMVFFVLIPIYTNVSCMCTAKIIDNNDKDEDVSVAGCMKLLCTSCYTAYKKYEKILLPYWDKPRDSDAQSSQLSASQTGFFLIFYMLSMFFWGFAFIIFCVSIMIPRLKNVKAPDKDINKTGLMCQFLSQFCAIHSCFIFSKITYGVSNKCHQLSEKLKNIDVSDSVFHEFQYQLSRGYMPAPDHDQSDEQKAIQKLQKELTNHKDITDEYVSKFFIPEEINQLYSPLPGLAGNNDAKFFIDQARYSTLKAIDDNFIKESKASIAPYYGWFAVHWFLYSITAFMSLSFLVETYIRYLYGDHHHREWWHANPKQVWKFFYIVLFTINHVFLFLYPCFRAAMLTHARAKAIKEFINHKWKYLSPSLQANFHNHMVAQGFGFKISIFCAEMTFGFNLAFISIFIGMFGIIIKLSL